MFRSSTIAATLAVFALPTFGLVTTAAAKPRHGGHPHVGGHRHGGHAHGGHPHHRPHRGGRPHGGAHHGFGPRFSDHGDGSRLVFRGGRHVVVRPYPIFVGGPVGQPRIPRGIGYGVPAAGGCSTRRSVSLTPYGWHRVVTVKTCIQP